MKRGGAVARWIGATVSGTRLQAWVLALVSGASVWRLTGRPEPAVAALVVAGALVLALRKQRGGERSPQRSRRLRVADAMISRESQPSSGLETLDDSGPGREAWARVDEADDLASTIQAMRVCGRSAVVVMGGGRVVGLLTLDTFREMIILNAAAEPATPAAAPGASAGARPAGVVARRVVAPSTLSP